MQMGSFEEFARECDVAAKNLRRVPKELRRALSGEVKTEVAEPLAGDIRQQAHGPWANILAAGTKARASADPQIVVGGTRPRLSGGAGPRQVIFGAEFGGGKRTSFATSSRGKRFKRRSTRQFAQHQDPFVFPTIRARGQWVLDKFADIVIKVLEKEVK